MKFKEWVNGKRYFMNNNYFEVFHNYTSKSLDIEIHSHDFYEALFFMRGNVSICIEDKTYIMHPGDILLTNSREFHKATVKNGSPYERYVMWFHPDFVTAVSDFLKIDASECFSSVTEKHNNLVRTNTYEFDKFIAKINELPLNNENGSQEITALHQCIAAQILSFLNDVYKKNSGDLSDIITNPTINDIVLYINSNLSEDLTLDTLSEKFHISKYHLTRQFNIYTGLPLHKFILAKRLNNSRIMIGEGADLYTAAFDSGFNNYSHFSKVFKDSYGIAPSKYREETAAL